MGHPAYATALGLDGWRATICWRSLTDDVLLDDELEGLPLSPEHGGPLRLVSPAQYGFMSVKHLSRLDLHETDPGWPRRVRVVSPHPRARVAREERRADLPGVVSRAIYRPLLGTFLCVAGAGEDGRPVRAVESPMTRDASGSSSSSSLARNSVGRCGVKAGLGRAPATRGSPAST